MSKVNKRKHVMKEMQIDDFDPPESNQRICRILSSRGNNLHEVEAAEAFTGTTPDTIPSPPPPSTGATNATADTDNDGGGSDACCQFLVSMPTKFRKNVWVKRGDFVIAEPIDEGDKVKAEIVRILTAQHIKEFKKLGIWPQKFTSKDRRAPDATPNVDGKLGSDNDNDLFVNTNRAHHTNDDSQESSDSESSENNDTDASDADSEDNANDTEENDTNGKDDTGKK